MPTRLGTNMVLGGTGPVPPRPPLVSAPPGRATRWVGGGALKAPWAGARWVSTTVTTQASFSGTHVYQLPTVQVGDRLVLVASCLDGLASFTPTTDLSAWTSFLASELNPFHCWRGYTLYIADAAAVTAWSGVTVTFASANGGKSTAVVVRAEAGRAGGLDDGWDHSGPSATGSDTQPNPPQLVPAWSGNGGLDDHVMWLTFTTFGSGGDSATAQPQDYHDLAQGGAAADQTTTAVAVRYTIAGGEDPGAFTLSGAENHQALTFGIRAFQPVVVDDRAGGARMAAAVVGQAVGAKAVAGGGRLGHGVAPRVFGLKATATGAARALAAVTGRASGAKATGGAGRLAAAVIGRAAGTKVGVGSANLGLAVTGRAQGAKGVAAAAQAAFTVVGRVAGTAASTAGRGATAAFGVVMRVAGTKGASGGSRATSTAVGRLAGAKSATGAARSSSSVTPRVGGAKVGAGAARAMASVVVRTSGSRSALGAARASVGVLVRTAGTKSSQGATRLAWAILGRVLGVAGGGGPVDPTPLGEGHDVAPLEVHAVGPEVLVHQVEVDLVHTVEAVTVHEVAPSTL